MSASDKFVTERDAVLRERNAFENGIIRGGAERFTGLGAIQAVARQAFPLPTVTRPRVVEDSTGIAPVLWRVVDGELEYRPKHGPHLWRRVGSHDSGMFVFSARVKFLAALLENPTEEVEDAP